MSAESKSIPEMVKSLGKEETILQEMIRLGYWPEEGTLPNDPADELRKRTQLRKDLQKLRAELTRKEDTERELRKLRRQRLKESKQKRLENKRKREEEKKRKAELWQERKSREITYIGDRVSKGIHSKEANKERLAENSLPFFESEEEIAKSMEISVNELRFLCYDRQVSQVSHYSRFAISKKSGGQRFISAPKRHLKKQQYWLLENILNKVSLSEACHGFCPEKSILTNAEGHIGAKTLINVDLENFFPTFTFKRVKGLFQNLGYSEKQATIFSLLATEAKQEEFEIDNERWFISLDERTLPQGAPSSPALTNIICRSLDRRLTKLAEKFSLKYTRYADDLTFSTKEDIDSKTVGQFMRQLNYLIAGEGLKINEAKTRISRPGSRKEVTGIVVNEKASIPRKKLKAFRATLHQIEQNGLEGRTWGNPASDLIQSIQGYADFVYMVDPEKGQAFKEQVARIIAKYGDHSAKPVSYMKEDKKLLVAERPETIERLRKEKEEAERLKAEKEAKKEVTYKNVTDKMKPKGNSESQKVRNSSSNEEPPKEEKGCLTYLFWAWVIFWILKAAYRAAVTS